MYKNYSVELLRKVISSIYNIINKQFCALVAQGTIMYNRGINET